MLLLNWRVWAAIALSVLLAFTHLTVYRAGKTSTQRQWDAAKVVQERAAQTQAEANRELQRKAELNYVVKGETRDRFFVTTVKEIHEAAAPLAACAVPHDVVRLLNDANHCASDDSSASCGPAAKVPNP